MKPSLQFHRFLLTLATSLCVLSGARAALVMGDLFDSSSGYTVGSNLFGQSSTAYSYGFTAPWAGINSNFFTVQTINMTMAGISNVPSTVRIQGGNGASRAVSRNFSSISGQSTLWFSSLMRVDANALNASNGIDQMFGVTSGSVPTTSAASGSGALWSTSNGGALAGFQVGVSSGDTLKVRYQSDASGTGAVTTADTGFTLAPSTGAAYFLVSQLQINVTDGSDVLKIWVLNSVPTDESAILAISPTFTVNANMVQSSADMNTLMLNAYGSSSTLGGLYMDAVHLGTSYSDVIAAVPENSSLAMAALGAGILFCVRRVFSKRKSAATL